MEPASFSLCGARCNADKTNVDDIISVCGAMSDFQLAATRCNCAILRISDNLRTFKCLFVAYEVATFGYVCKEFKAKEHWKSGSTMRGVEKISLKEKGLSTMVGSFS